MTRVTHVVRSRRVGVRELSETVNGKKGPTSLGSLPSVESTTVVAEYRITEVKSIGGGPAPDLNPYLYVVQDTRPSWTDLGSLKDQKGRVLTGLPDRLLPLSYRTSRLKVVTPSSTFV